MASPGSVVIQFAVKAADAARDAAKLATSLGKVDDEASTVDASLRDAQRGIDKTGTAARDSVRDLDKAETGFDQLGDEADRTADRLRTSAREMADGVRSGAQGIDTETGNIKTSMKEAGTEAGSEFIQNIAEGIGSGQANLNDVVTGTLGGITNLAASMPGIGTAAAVAAAGIGLVFQAVKGESEKAKAKIDELRGALEGVADLAGKEAKEAIFQAWVESAQEVTGKIEKVDAVLTRAGVSADDFQSALAGDPAAMERVRVALQKQGIEIIKNKRETGLITDEQQAYLDNMGMVLQDINASDKALGAVRREHESIERLSGETASNTDKMAGNIDDATDSAEELNDELDHAARNRTVNFQVNVKGGQTMGELLGSIPRTATAAGPASRAAEQPINIAVYNQGPAIPNTPRGLVDLLETHTVRMGRKPGTPRPVAW